MLAPDALQALEKALTGLDSGRAGERLGDIGCLSEWTDLTGPVGAIAAHVLGPRARPVRAILFDKNEINNWSLAWHQDRTIAVRRREPIDGFEPWTVKAGVPHVEPPFDFIERMLTLRVHLDPVMSDNGPLLISPGTHSIGKLLEDQIEPAIRRFGVITCTAKAGDVWAYRTAILHASARSSRLSRRRVLQLDYSADDLPPPLRWGLAA